MLDVQPLRHLCQGDALAHLPELLCLGQVLRHHGIAHAAIFQGGLQKAVKLLTCMGLGFVVRVFQQHTPGALPPQGHSQLGQVPVDQVQGKLPHQLKAGQACA